MYNLMNNFILSRIWGGLGNQMFQYALAKKLSILNDNAPIKLDVTYFDSLLSYRPFELKKLNIKASLATKEDIFNLDNGSLNKKLGRLIEKIPYIRVKDFIRRPFSNVYTEKTFRFDSNVLKIKPAVYLKGYWNSYKYFEGIRKELLDDFSFTGIMNEENKRIANIITNSNNSISLHVRRGDYLTTKGARDFFPSPYEDGFYDRAISYLENKVDNPEFFIFSDEPDWVKDNLKIAHKTTVVDINKGENSYWDMKLMSLCKHNITANSTFSWWAAWLNENPNKIVIAPKAWMNDKTFSIEDLIPKEWFIL